MKTMQEVTADELQRLASILRWVGLSVTAVGVLTTFGSHYIADQLISVQKRDKAAAQARAKQSEDELSQTKQKTAILENKIHQLTVDRVLTSEQKQIVISELKGKVTGKVIVTFLSVEKDAQKFSEQIVATLKEAGLDARLSMNLWLQLSYDGVYLAVADKEAVPVAARPIQDAFLKAGIQITGTYDKDIIGKVGGTPDAIVIAVSNRKAK